MSNKSWNEKDEKIPRKEKLSKSIKIQTTRYKTKKALLSFGRFFVSMEKPIRLPLNVSLIVGFSQEGPRKCINLLKKAPSNRLRINQLF